MSSSKVTGNKGKPTPTARGTRSGGSEHLTPALKHNTPSRKKRNTEKDAEAIERTTRQLEYPDASTAEPTRLQIDVSVSRILPADNTETQPPRSPSPPHNDPNMAEQIEKELRERVDKMVQDKLEAEKEQIQADRDQLAQDKEKMFTEMQELRVALQREHEQKNTDYEGILRQTTKLGGKVKTNEDIRKPSAFHQPSLATTTDVFFADYERYIKEWKPTIVKALATHLPTYLAGDAGAFYHRQSPAVKDDYEDIKDSILQYYHDSQEEIKGREIGDYNPSKQTVNEYLQTAKEFFKAKGIKDPEAIQQLQLRMKGEFKAAMLIHKPKTWTELSRWLRNAHSSSTSTHSVAAIMEIAPGLVSECNKPMREQMEAMIEEMRKNNKEASESLAAMGSVRPNTTKAARTPNVGNYPDLPEDHKINANYTGPKERYDPLYIEKVRARKEKQRKKEIEEAAEAMFQKHLKERGEQPPPKQQQQQQPPPQYQNYPQQQQQPPQYQNYHPQQQQWNNYPQQQGGFQQGSNYNNNQQMTMQPYQQQPPQQSSTSQQAPAAGAPALTWPFPHGNIPPPSSQAKPQGN